MKIYKALSNKSSQVIDQRLEELGKKSNEYIDNLENLKTDSKKRYESFYKRKKIIDLLIYINLVTSPILFGISMYYLFFQ